MICSSIGHHPARRVTRILNCLAYLALAAASPLLGVTLPRIGLGARIVGTGAPVTVRIVPTSAFFTSDVFILDCVPADCLFIALGTNHSASETPLRTFAEGEEVLFGIDVQETLSRFEVGPASRNVIDRLAHAVVTQNDDGSLRVGFEDVLDGGDRDYDDVILEVEGARICVPFSGLEVMPFASSLLNFGLAGELQVAPIAGTDPGGISVSLGEADGWKGQVGFDGQAPGALLSYTTLDVGGEPDVIGRHTTLSDGLTQLAMTFPKATHRNSLQVDAFLADNLVASTQVAPTTASQTTFEPATISASGTTTIKIAKETTIKPDGTVVIRECIIIQSAAISGVIAGVGEVTFDRLMFTLIDEGLSPLALGELNLGATNAPELTLDHQSVSQFNRFHRDLEGAMLASQGGTLTLADPLAGDDMFGVSIDLGEVEDFELAWAPFEPLGFTLSDSYFEFGAHGRVNDTPDQPLGTLRVTQLAQVDTKAEITADFSAVNSPTHRILLYDHGVLIADIPGQTGIVAQATAWPTGGGKGPAIFDDIRLSCYTLCFPDDTWIKIPGMPMLPGDRMLILADNPAAGVESVSEFSMRASRLPPLTLTVEETTPLPLF